MDRDPALIVDIVLMCRRLRTFVAGRSREDLERDELLQYAALHAIALIGEAATRLSPDFLQAHPEIPWRDIIGTRHRIIHGYDQVKLNGPTALLRDARLGSGRSLQPCPLLIQLSDPETLNIIESWLRT